MASAPYAVDRVGQKAATIGRVAAAERDTYANGEVRPLGSYLILLGAYAGGVIGLGTWVRRRGRRRPLPERPPLADLALMAVATHRLTRIVAKDSVTAALRAPFTRFVEPAGEGEVTEEVRGQGIRHAIGELLTCPFCLAQWAATGLTFGLLLAPRATRWAASVLAVVTASDVLHVAYGRLKSSDS